MRTAPLLLLALLLPAAASAQALPNRYRGVWARLMSNNITSCQRSEWEGIGQSHDSLIEVTPDRISFYEIVCDLRKYSSSYKGSDPKIDDIATINSDFICEENGKKTPEKILMTIHKSGNSTFLNVAFTKWATQDLYLRCQ